MTSPPVVAVACSGGRDSLALLHATLKAAKAQGLQVLALHVHHNLLPQADDWARRLAARCARWSAKGWPIRCEVARLRSRPTAGDSIEAWARRERYAALARMARAAGCELVLLAHHRRDQAETFFLQALRGAGSAGLSAMPVQQEREGIVWARPWLHQPRERIEAYLRRHRLGAVDDPSNSDLRHARSRLRAQVWPSLIEAFPDAEERLCDAAARLQRERLALDEWAREEVARLSEDDGSLRLRDWAALGPGRREVCLREWLQQRQGRGGSDALVERLLQEVPAGSQPRRWTADRGELRRYRDRLQWSPGWAGMPTPANNGAASAAPHDEVRDAEHEVPVVLHLHHPGCYEVHGWGALQVDRVTEGGVPFDWLAEVRLTRRAAAARFQFEPRSTPRSLKKQFQARGVPAWERQGPLLWSGDRLVFVPGLGIDARALAAPGQPRALLQWWPAKRDL